MSEPFKLVVIVTNNIGTSIAVTTLSYQYQEQAEKSFWALTGADDMRVLRAYEPTEQYQEENANVKR